MKKEIWVLMLIIFSACKQPKADKEIIKQQITDVEKSFETMAKEKGIAEAFVFYADDQAVIKREHDTLIIGKQNIKNYYSKYDTMQVTVTWNPDFIDVSEDASFAYTYGKYIWTVKKDTVTKEFKGIFHTVWKKQNDNTWKYVWD